MRWQGRHPAVKHLEGDYGPGSVEPCGAEGRRGAAAASASLPKYDITIQPQRSGERQVE